MIKQLIQSLRNLLGIPTTTRFRVDNTDGIDLIPYHNSLHFFFEEPFWLDQTVKYDEFKKRIVYISTGKTEDIIEAIYYPENISIQEICDELQKIGIAVTLTL